MRRTKSIHIARSIAATSDLETTLAGADELLDELQSQGREELAALAGTSARTIARLDAAVRRCQGRRDRCVNAFHDRYESRLARRQTLERWRKAGLADRYTDIAMPGWVRIGILVALAVIDAIVFSKPAAVALDARESPTDPVWWVGLSFGLIAFGTGFLLARGLRTMQMARFQRAIIELWPNSMPSSTVLADPQSMVSLVLGAFFALFCVAGTLVRIEGGSSDMRSVLILQLIVPLVAVAVEFVLHDPTHVRLPKRSIVAQISAAQLTRRRERLARAHARAEARRDLIRAQYDAAEARLVRRLFDLGFR